MYTCPKHLFWCVTQRMTQRNLTPCPPSGSSLPLALQDPARWLDKPDPYFSCNRAPKQSRQRTSAGPPPGRRSTSRGFLILSDRPQNSRPSQKWCSPGHLSWLSHPGNNNHENQWESWINWKHTSRIFWDCRMKNRKLLKPQSANRHLFETFGMALALEPAVIIRRIRRAPSIFGQENCTLTIAALITKVHTVLLSHPFLVCRHVLAVSVGIGPREDGEGPQMRGQLDVQLKGASTLIIRMEI